MTLEEKTSPNLENYPKAEREFQDWYVKQPFNWSYSLAFFPKMRFAMQSGVYLAFLREKGINICIIPKANCLPEWPNVLHTAKILNMSSDFISASSHKTEPDYNTALIAAIEAGFACLETPSV